MVQIAFKTGFLGQWAVIKDGDQIDKTRYVEITMFYNGRIPYHNIIEYDINGDEYYNCPHIYCNFSNNGTPYEDYRFVEVDNNYTLYPEKRFLYKDGV